MFFTKKLSKICNKNKAASKAKNDHNLKCVTPPNMVSSNIELITAFVRTQTNPVFISTLPLSIKMKCAEKSSMLLKVISFIARAIPRNSIGKFSFYPHFVIKIVLEPSAQINHLKNRPTTLLSVITQKSKL